ncbi:hypothetical protein Holit_01468 [Hollandina sp. SP2]
MSAHQDKGIKRFELQDLFDNLGRIPRNGQPPPSRGMTCWLYGIEASLARGLFLRNNPDRYQGRSILYRGNPPKVFYRFGPHKSDLRPTAMSICARLS